MKDERWVDVKGWEGLYQISDYGRLKSFCKRNKKHGYILSNKNKKGGYLSVILKSKGRHNNSTRIHRLVAEHFIPNPENKPQVNHIDGDKQNNHYTNLEWATCSENIVHAIGMNANMIRGMNYYNKIVRPKSIAQFSMDGKRLATFNNCLEASRITGVCYRNIYSVATKEEYRPGRTRKQAGGYKWEFLE